MQYMTTKTSDFYRSSSKGNKQQVNSFFGKKKRAQTAHANQRRLQMQTLQQNQSHVEDKGYVQLEQESSKDGGGAQRDPSIMFQVNSSLELKDIRHRQLSNCHNNNTSNVLSQEIIPERNLSVTGYALSAAAETVQPSGMHLSGAIQ